MELQSFPNDKKGEHRQHHLRGNDQWLLSITYQPRQKSDYLFLSFKMKLSENKNLWNKRSEVIVPNMAFILQRHEAVVDEGYD